MSKQKLENEEQIKVPPRKVTRTGHPKLREIPENPFTNLEDKYEVQQIPEGNRVQLIKESRKSRGKL